MELIATLSLNQMETIENVVLERFVCEKFESYMLEPGLLYMHYFENCEIGESEIQKGFDLHDTFELDHNVKRIIHCEQFVSISKRARELVEAEGRPAKAEAYVIPALSQKILFNLYFKLRKRKHPLKAFDELNEAMRWLREF